MPRDPMHSGPEDRERIGHMLEAARDVVAFVAMRRREDVDTDAMLRRALVNALQVIGEAAARVTDSGRQRVPSLPWGKIVATRNVLVHVYWGVDHEQIWKMATTRVPEMIAALEAACDTWPLPDTPTD
ncbi:MAG: DUF86 domain-containing protein [Pyrinomonadaceae bacterium]|nr:DUF86 domain-containing protein [Phycisphaerales bacterium]